MPHSPHLKSPRNGFGVRSSGMWWVRLANRAIAIVCPHCNGYIETNTPWKCGNPNCQKDNERTDDFPVVYRCQHCGVEQKAFECPHPNCGQSIYLGRDKLKNIYARFVKMPEKSKPKPASRDPIVDKKFKQQQEKVDLEHEVEMARLKGDLKDAKSKIEPVKIKTTKERLQSRVHGKMELDDEVRRMKAEIDEKFKNDPVEREKRHRLLEDEARDLL